MAQSCLYFLTKYIFKMIFLIMIYYSFSLLWADNNNMLRFNLDIGTCTSRRRM